MTWEKQDEDVKIPILLEQSKSCQSSDESTWEHQRQVLAEGVQHQQVRSRHTLLGHGGIVARTGKLSSFACPVQNTLFWMSNVMQCPKQAPHKGTNWQSFKMPSWRPSSPIILVFAWDAFWTTSKTHLDLGICGKCEEQMWLCAMLLGQLCGLREALISTLGPLKVLGEEHEARHVQDVIQDDVILWYGEFHGFQDFSEVEWLRKPESCFEKILDNVYMCWMLIDWKKQIFELFWLACSPPILIPQRIAD